MLAVTGLKHGNSIFYLAFVFFFLSIVSSFRINLGLD